jgi:hypothetical protein
MYTFAFCRVTIACFRLRSLWGRNGFDVGTDGWGACRGARGPRKNVQIVIGNNYALAA